MRIKDIGAELAATALGLGRLPLCPGTWASAGAAGVYLLLNLAPRPTAGHLLVLLFAGALVLGHLVCPWAIERYGSADPRPFVLDEVAGFFLAALLFWWRGPIESAAAIFVAFRIFDIAKPFPLRWLERLPGSWGVMLDDLGAALWTALVLLPLCHLLLAHVV